MSLMKSASLSGASLTRGAKLRKNWRRYLRQPAPHSPPTAALSQLFPKAMQTGSFLPKTSPGLGNQFFASATLTLTS